MGKIATMTVTGSTDWSSVRDTIDLAAVATRLLGPAPGRRGERGRKLWWPCPFHEDANPSFCVVPGKRWWHCYGCDTKGDVMDLVRRLNPAMSFPEAVAFLAGGPIPVRRSATPKPQNPRGIGVLGGDTGSASAPDESAGLPRVDALNLVAEAEQRLWTPEGAKALDYLREERGLSEETIRSARLGWSPRIQARTKDGRTYHVLGIVLPWHSGNLLTLVKVRQPGERKPKYAEVFRDPARYLGVYPGRHVVRIGLPLVITEGEFDALLLGQELAELAAVVTLGSASGELTTSIRGALLFAAPWYVATDNDEAGDKAAAKWPARCRRVRPPGAFKDWTEAHQAGVNLRRWWSEVLAGNERPPLFTWEELSKVRWGENIEDPEAPGLDVGTPFTGRGA